MQAHHPSLLAAGRKRRNPSRAGRDLSPKARSRPGWLCIVTSKTGEATSYRGRADAGRRQQVERKEGRWQELTKFPGPAICVQTAH